MLRERQAGVAGPIHSCEHRIAQPRGGCAADTQGPGLAVWEQKPEKQRAREKVLLLGVLVLNFADSYYLTKVTFIRTLLLANYFSVSHLTVIKLKKMLTGLLSLYIACCTVHQGHKNPHEISPNKCPGGQNSLRNLLTVLH